MTFDKKTDRIEVRVSPEQKSDFAAACDRSGETPSSAIRRFVRSYIRRDGRDGIVFALRRAMLGSTTRARLAAGGAALTILAVVGAASFGMGQSSLAATPVERDPEFRTVAESFDIMDWDKNGRVEVGEISTKDALFVTVLDLDGSGDLSPDEFRHRLGVTLDYTDQRPAECLTVYIDSLDWNGQSPGERRLDGILLNSASKMEGNRHQEAFCGQGRILLDPDGKIISRQWVD